MLERENLLVCFVNLVETRNFIVSNLLVGEL